jgi:alpha-tubulin suppressor-like RCC1 family protein
LAIDKNGEIWTMGDNPNGQQGQGDNTRILEPTKIHVEKHQASSSVQSSSSTSLKVAKYAFFFLSVLLNIYLFFKLLRKKRIVL